MVDLRRRVRVSTDGARVGREGGLPPRRGRVLRFVPEAALPYLSPPTAPTPAVQRDPAVRTLLAAYRSPAHLARGVLVWLGLAAATFMVVFGAASLVEAATIRGLGSSSTAIGAVLLVIGVPLGAWWARVGRAVMTAGRAVSTAAEAWLLSGPAARDTLLHRSLALASPLIPELFPRMLLGSVSALVSVLAVCGTGSGIWQASSATGIDLILAWAFAAFFLALAVLCGAVAVALWRSTARVQRGWTHAAEIPR